MECNKEEAIRAKEMAEKKMQSGDFLGARKVALRAQQLFPELENISQLLTVCEVHCSAQSKIYGSEMDWYGILQTDRVADEVTIKKQYRKLALLLHPDKNKFAGAEAAFKLIGEANRMLSDQGKRSLYDMKCRVPVRTAAPKPPPHQVNRTSYVRKQYGVQNNFPSVSNPTFTGLNPHQQMQSGFHNGRETFWTWCPFCSMRYQYYKDIVNRTLKCQTCGKSYTAYDLFAQGTPGPTLSQPVFDNQKGSSSAAAFQAGSQSTGVNPPSGMAFPGRFTNRNAGSEPVFRTGSTADVFEGSKTKGKEDGHVHVRGGRERVRMAKGTSGNMRKRGRKLVVESSESSESASSNETEEKEVIEDNGCNYARPNAGLNGDYHPRRSSRQKQHISYNESDDDDFVSPPKRSRGNGSSNATEEEMKEAAWNGGVSKTNNLAGFAFVVDKDKEEIKQKTSSPPEESLLKRKRKAGEGSVNGTEAAMADHSDEKSKVDDNSELNTCAAPEIFEYPDPDFSDFDKDKSEDCFDVDQVWAIYDTLDGMPRFYARVRKVFSPGFKLRITWFEPHPDVHGEINWVNEGLPVSCGKFKHGISEDTTDRLMFSHQVYWEKGSSRYTYAIYPRKGETWALFKDWNIRWCSSPENQKQFKFEFVVVLSDFVQDHGIRVAYLGKVKGFVSVFQQTTQNETGSFRIPPSELLRFSHRIPSFRLTGAEREGVPKGSFELDPVSLPTDLEEFGDPSDVKMQKESMDAEANGSKLRRSLRESNSMPKKQSQLNTSQCTTGEETDKNMGDSKDDSHDDLNESRGSSSHQVDERINTPTKHEKTDLEGEISKIRRSPRELNGKKRNQHSTQDETSKHLDGSKEKNHGSLTQSTGSASSCQAGEKMHLNGKDRSSNSSLKNHAVTPSMSSGLRTPEAKLYDFNEDKSEEKFQPGQIWALYSDTERLPKVYAEVMKIESTPDFKVHVALLEACSPPKGANHPVCCGIFKLKNGKTKVFARTDFSHQLSAEPFDKNRFGVFPRKGEVWAIYKNWNTELTCSDLKNCEYDIVEVLEDNEQNTKVSVLERADGSNSVFKPPRRQRSNTGIMDIPRIELPRFSHQIPAIVHTGEKDNRLRGCWVLDPTSIPPGIIICLD